MLELKDIKKTYVSGDEKVEALKGINLKFRESEFVSILGQSGCGKTTLLNIIGGLDRYTSGDLIINGKSTKKFKDRDWDAYRNYKVGFVFQSYNLIGHQTILSNVELALTIGGISKKERKERAIKALEEVGLKEQIHKKPNQLSGGQMQRVAIARALVNNPDIILADEPTGALDTKTSVQVMEILNKISKDKLIVMVTHNPELAQQYSSRIIRILDGNITEDSNPIINEEQETKTSNEIGKTSMKFWTAFRLSLNNLLTKKGRTVLVAFAGSIGIIGIALIQAVSNGFQGYVDQIQEDTLTSYPLSIMQETTDITGALLSLRTDESEESDDGTIKEEQYISKMLESLSTNDLKSFKHYLEENENEIKDDVSSIKYSYSVEPMIYTVDATEKIAKLSPANLFSSPFLSNMSSVSTSIYSQMTEDMEILNNSYDILAGRWPEKYDEMIIVLSERNSISDLLVYSLGLRKTEELQSTINSIMSGEKVELNNEPMNFTYEDLMNTNLKLIMPTDLYKYNEQYEIYEDMSEDEEYLQNVYDNAINLKIVGIVTAKEGVTTLALNSGVSYTGDLVDYIIDYSANTDIVKKQIENPEIDVLSGSRFDEPKKGLDVDFTDLVSIDESALKKAFNININQNKLKNQTEGYMLDISNSVNADIEPAKKEIIENLNIMANEIFESIDGKISVDDVDKVVDNYLKGFEPNKIMTSLESKYLLPKDVFKTAYSGLLKGLLQIYINSYYTAGTYLKQGEDAVNSAISQEEINSIKENTENIVSSLPEETQNVISSAKVNITEKVDEKTEPVKEKADEVIAELPENVQNIINSFPEKAEKMIKITTESDKPVAVVDDDIAKLVLSIYTKMNAIDQTAETMGKVMTETVMRRDILLKVAELTGKLSESIATAFKVDESKIAGAFKMNMTEDEITRIVKAMLSQTETNAKTNLVNFGYQDKEEPTYISFYFKSFDGKEHFIDFISSYNEKVKASGEESKEINYSDTTGILMNSVKIIVSAVTYVLIAFVSISLVVSSIMIGIITYISVYERTKEIGILRAIGASKRNISSIFNAETFIIGLLSGLFGLAITYSLIPIINAILHHFTGNIPLNATLYFSNAIILMILSVILTIIGGLIPARAASKKDPVIALRTE